MKVTREVVDAIKNRSAVFSNWVSTSVAGGFPKDAFKKELDVRRSDTIYEEVIALAPNLILTLISIIIWGLRLAKNDEVVAIFFTSQYLVGAFQSLSYGYVQLVRLDRFLKPFEIDSSGTKS